MNIRPLCLVLVLLASSARAQSPQNAPPAKPAPSKPETPVGPLINPVGDYAQWEDAFTYPEDKQKSVKRPDRSLAARLRSTVTTKTGRIIHEVQTHVDDSVTELWFNGQSEYVKLGSNPVWFELRPGEALHSALPVSAAPLPPSGYRDVEFIQSINYAGVLTNDKGRYLVFTPGGYQQLDLRDAAQQKRMDTVEIIGYIDDALRLPVAIRAHGVLRTFQFDPPPSQMLSFPPDLADQLKKGAEASARLAMPAYRAY